MALFGEGITTMKPIENPSDERDNIERNLCVDHHVTHNIQIFGWDMDEATYEQKRLAIWNYERDGEKDLPQNKVKSLNLVMDPIF